MMTINRRSISHPGRGTALLFFVLFLCFLSSCENDAYEKGEGRYSLLRAELADIHVGADRKADYFDTDDSRRYTVDNPFTAKNFTTADSVYRLGVYYKEVAADRAEVTGLTAVAVLRPKHIERDALQTDPVRFESAWMSQNGRYLNASIYLLLGSTDDEDARQLLGIAADTLMLNPDSTRTLHLRLFHDQAGVPEYYSQRTFLSIPLENEDADSVRIRINTYQGEIEKAFALFQPL